MKKFFAWVSAVMVTGLVLYVFSCVGFLVYVLHMSEGIVLNKFWFLPMSLTVLYLMLRGAIVIFKEQLKVINDA